MPNQLDANGLQVASLSEVVGQIGGSTGIIPALAAVFGQDINVAANTPDGQLINIFAQAVVDMLETLLDVYNMFFVDNAYGVALDQIVALNGIARKAGSYTVTYVQVTVPGPMTLTGLDTVTPMTIPDDAGNQWELLTSKTFAAAGTATLAFRAALLGQVQVTAGTITGSLVVNGTAVTFANPAANIATTGNTTNTSPVVTGIPSTAGMTAGMNVACAAFPAGTTILSVDSASQVTLSANATSTGAVSLTVTTPATVIGSTEETDVQLKVRRAQSFYLQTAGPADAIRAALLALADVADAYVAENNTNATVNGVPAYGVWIIVNGGTAAEIGGAIYSKKAPGCAMKGSQSYNVPRPQGNTFTAQWDNAIAENLYIRATLNPRIPGLVFDLTSDAAALAAALNYKLGQSPSIGDVILAMAAIEPNAVLSSVQVSSDGSTWEDIVTPSDFQHYFVAAAARITLSEA